MREISTKCGVAPKGSILNICRLRQNICRLRQNICRLRQNICRLRQNICSPDLNRGTCEQQRAAVDMTGGDCHVNALAKRQKTRYESKVQRSTRLSKQSLLALSIYVRRYPAILFPLLPWQNFLFLEESFRKGNVLPLKRRVCLSLVLIGKSVWT